MTKNIAKLTNQEFLKQFEELTLDPVHFDHKGHIRLGWLYLTQFEFEKANEKVCHGIKRYAEHLGASEKFNLTITHSIMKIMSKRLDVLEDKSWESFITSNNDIIDDALEVLNLHFTQALLFSEVAKNSLVVPDIKPLEGSPNTLTLSGKLFNS